MYSGRISEVGTVAEAGSRLVIESPKTTTGRSAGGSVSVSSTCMSAVVLDEAAGSFAAEVSAETAGRSTLGQIRAAARVNLELPLRVGDRLDGHPQTEHQRGGGLTRLRRDLGNGTWAARHRALLNQPEHDCGYRLIIAGVGR